jgi:hypothetical protein
MQCNKAFNTCTKICLFPIQNENANRITNAVVILKKIKYLITSSNEVIVRMYGHLPKSVGFDEPFEETIIQLLYVYMQMLCLYT